MLLRPERNLILSYISKVTGEESLDLHLSFLVSGFQLISDMKLYLAVLLVPSALLPALAAAELVHLSLGPAACLKHLQ